MNKLNLLEMNIVVANLHIVDLKPGSNGFVRVIDVMHKDYAREVGEWLIAYADSDHPTNLEE